MEIVIKIPEELYKQITVEKLYFLEDGENLCTAVENGTPLSKGHGNLIDENELLEITKSYKSELGRLKVDPFVKSGIETVERFIKEMPPIIEADKESEE